MRLSFLSKTLLVVAGLLLLLGGWNYSLEHIPALRDFLENEYVQRAISTPYFSIGDLPVTPGLLLRASVFLLLLGLFSGAMRRFLRDRLLIHTSLDAGQRYAFARVAGYVVFLLGVVVGLQSAGVNLSSLLLVGGAVGIGVGFGLQNVANNFIAGLILLIERPLRVGDRVEVEGIVGDVVRIVARSTWIRTNDNVVIIVPNSELTEKRVVNWTANDRRVRFAVPFGVSYGSDPEHVRKVALEVAAKHPDVLADRSADVIFTGFGDSSLNFELRVWTETRVENPKILISDLYYALFPAFREHKIEIPFPQRDLHLKSVAQDVSLRLTGLQEGFLFAASRILAA